ncbi:hypothetical protein GCM10023176_27740 [Micromonospora coerulea]|uniref:CHRD domain-containing protein n=1 Tax=Micromonospora coerulea TaxID=47856 RepID=A0ABP8SIL5_9ACTN
MAVSAAVAGTAVGSAAMGDGRDSPDSRDSQESRDSDDKRDSRDSDDKRDSWNWDDWRDSRDSDDWGDSWDERETVRARLSGYEEDPLTISTPGSGRFVAHIDERNEEIRFRLSYEDLEDVQQAHIHFGGRHQSGGIAAFLCSNLGDGKGGAPKGTQRCPESPATISGTITPEDVIGPADQGIEPGEFDELVDAIEAGVTYANVHTKKYPAGEIRGQIKSDDDRSWDKDDDWSWDKADDDWSGNTADDDWSRDKADDDWGRDVGDDDRGHDKGDDRGKGKSDD